MLQHFHDTKRSSVSWYDFATGEVRPMHGRTRLTPYYFVVGDEVRLGGATATVVPMDKKLIHGMVDAVIVPCAPLPGHRAGRERARARERRNPLVPWKSGSDS